MTEAQVTSTVHSRAAIDVRAIALPRAEWAHDLVQGRLAVTPQKGTWYGHKVRGRAAHDFTIIPMVGCPNCGALRMLSHTPETARAISKAHGGGLPVPIAHRIDHLGKVSPDFLCGGCDFHRRLYLDRWNKTKALFAIAYVDAAQKIQIDYCHAVDRREAAYHYAGSTGGRKGCRFIDAGPAVGFFVDEKTGRVSAD